jgi:hypothetical protein
MNPFRTMRTAGLLKSLLDLLFWAIVLLAPVYAVLVMVGYQRPGLQLWVQVDLPFAGLFVGVALLVAAAAFRRGAQLEEEQALTV